MKESISLRIYDKVLEGLKTQSNHKSIGLNTLISQILENYVHWDMNSIEAGWIPMQRNIIKLFFDSLKEEQIRKIAKISAKDVTKDILLFTHGEYNLEGLLTTLRHKTSRSGFYVKEFKTESSHRFVVQHDMGLNWSIFHEQFYEQIFHDLGYPVKFDHTPSTLVLVLKI